MLLAAAGNVDHEALLALVRASFGELSDRRVLRNDSARYVGGELREERELEQVHVVLGFPGFAFGDPDYYAASVVSSALGGGMSSRLFQEIREKRGLVYSIYAFTHSYSDSGIFGVYAGTGEDEVGELMPVLCEEMNKLAQGLTPVELARARAQLKAGLLMSLESTTARCEQQAAHMLVFGRPLDMAEMVARIDAVDAAAVARVAARLKSAPPTLAALGPVSRVDAYGRLVERLGA
jgi:predicted Zn-dependent peptidase